jgi:hypothetical protein
VSRVLAAYTILAAGLVVALPMALLMLTAEPRTPLGSVHLLLPAVGQIRSLPVSVIDRTGLLVDAGAAVAPFAMDGAESVPGQHERVRVTWTGGTCDSNATMHLDREGIGLRLTIESFVIGKGCPLAWISRSVDLVFAGPIDPARITVRTG